MARSFSKLSRMAFSPMPFQRGRLKRFSKGGADIQQKDAKGKKKHEELWNQN